jgi:chromosome segregation protein
MSMRLTKIKIAGFKSFVDPTTIGLPSNLIAVVGPNGCGKSNIIDAVTWVMGESSPKYLRGETSTDVIFNGSTARKPIGMASVELIFDNSDGTIGGEYAKYAEISVKRAINRDSDSSYFLNGARCRKRDVTDIFHGTGLGPRSYSIIGQNMISKIVESKPDDLRTYLEEAAGISKYKERRHETELRINHTKENLARVNDVNMELEKQLGHLKHQANVAEKFKVLKQQERVLRSELYAAQWRLVDSQMVDNTLQIQQQETAFEGRQADLTGNEREMEQLRHEQRVAQDAFQEVQRRYYAVGNEITRLEQDILHQQERQQQWDNDLKQADSEWNTVKEQASNAEQQLKAVDMDVEQLAPQVGQSQEETKTQEIQLTAAEEAMQTWQNRWDEFNQVSAKSAQTAQVEKNRIGHVEQRIAFLQKRQEQLLQDQHRFNFSELESEIETFASKYFEINEQLDASNKELTNVRTDISTQQTANQDANNSLSNTRNELQRLLGQQASLEALQQTALGQRDNTTSPWIKKYNLGANARLAQQIQVEKGFEMAAEKVLGFCLQAVCVDDIASLIPHLSDFKKGNLCVVSNRKAAAKSSHHKGSLLLDKIKSPLALESLLSGIYVAESLEAALKLCESLSSDESVITQDGVWLSPSWLKIFREDNPAEGVFHREQELKDLTSRIAHLQTTQKELETSITERARHIKELEAKRDKLQQQHSQLQSQAAQLSTQQKLKQERLTELKAQSVRYTKEQEECEAQLKQTNTELTEARLLWQQAMQELETQADTREMLIKERDKARDHLQSMRDAANSKRQQLHQIEIKLQTAKSQRDAIKQSISHLQQQMATLNNRKTSLQSELASLPPIDTVKNALSRALDKHVHIEAELNKARVAMEALDQEFRQLEENRQTIERELNKIRSELETHRVNLQGFKVKADTLLEKMAETECVLEEILKELPEDINIGEWQSKLDQTVQRINRLGPINLVAIDEYATCSERKQYLDKQVEDLLSGLKTLEEAIEKIDKETKTRFKETFDQVNQRFQELFPTIFGGGKAYLELNNENLLEAGVTLMACPPGKRNSTIYLLSGGEKSLTALAFIFSIFHLNPAPFCMLDEVDAALDDANVLRFTRLVKAMAEKTQFIFISHNKISIEMGEHLIGVTMNEPGVSRLVSVDIEKAMSLAGA